MPVKAVRIITPDMGSLPLFTADKAMTAAQTKIYYPNKDKALFQGISVSHALPVLGAEKGSAHIIHSVHMSYPLFMQLFAEKFAGGLVIIPPEAPQRYHYAVRSV